MDIEKTNEQLIWADILKVISIYAVILIHSAAPLLLRYESEKASWWIGNVYDSIARWCIPLFVMMSGMFLIGKMYEQSLSDFFRKRIRRVIMPFIIWSFIYMQWRIQIHNEDLDLLSFFSLFFMEPLYYHLWFMYLIAGLYLLTPIISIYLKNAEPKDLMYLLLLWFMAGSVLPTVESFFNIQTYLSTGTSNSIFKFLGYFVLGYALRDIRLRPPKLVLSVFIFIAGFFITVYGTYILAMRQDTGTFDETFYEYFSFNVFLMAVSVYLIGKSIRFPDFLMFIEKKKEIFRAAAACVPGIYLIHAVMIEISKKGLLGFTFSQETLHPAIGVPVFALGIFISSFVIVLAAKKVPGLKYLFP
jgi:surface polysaccharide O-acyltransferase-like enzyme